MEKYKKRYNLRNLPKGKKSSDKFKMSKHQTKLWGIQEILGGNQNKILACWPIVEYAKRIGAIRKIYWDIKSGVGIQWLDNQKDIKNMEEQTTKLISEYLT